MTHAQLPSGWVVVDPDDLTWLVNPQGGTDMWSASRARAHVFPSRSHAVQAAKDCDAMSILSLQVIHAAEAAPWEPRVQKDAS